MNPEERIIQGAGELFFRNGIRTVTMDDIASKLGISKKTIYNYFEDKNILVQSLTESILKDEHHHMLTFRDKSKNPVEEILMVMDHLSSFFQRKNPALFYDLQKYHPNAWHSFKSFKDQAMIGFVEENLKAGIKEELYRSNINIKVLSKLRIEQVEWGMNPLLFPSSEFNLKKVQLELLDHFLHGIVSMKGFKLIEKYKKQTKVLHSKI